MADARKKREQQEKNAISKEERDSRMKQARELAELRRSMAEAAKAMGENTVALSRADTAQKKMFQGSQASAKIAEIDTSGSASTKLIQDELAKLTAEMSTANAKDFKLLKAKAEYTASQVKNVTEEDREATALMAEHAMTAIAEIEKTTPKKIEQSLRGVGQSTLGFLDKSIGRNLLNKGLGLLGKTTLDQRKEQAEFRRKVAAEQSKALSDEYAAKREALDKQIAQSDEVASKQIEAAETVQESAPIIDTGTAGGGEVAAGGDGADLGDAATNLEEIKVWSELSAEYQEKINNNLVDGLGVRSPGYLNDIVGFFQGDKLSRIEEKREQQARDDAQLDALETIAEKEPTEGTAVVEAKGGGGSGLFGGIVKGFQGLLDLLKNVGSFIKDMITGLFDMIAKVMSSIGEGIGGLLKGIAKGLNAFKKESLIGAAAMVVVAGAMWVMAKALQAFTKVTWKAVGVGLVSLAALAVVTKLMGGPQVLLGAAGLLIVSGAMYVLAEAMNTFNGVDWKAVAVALVTVVSLGLVAAGLGAIAPIALAGAAAMLVIGAAMYVVAQALKVVAEAMNLAIPFFETIGGLIGDVIGAVAELIERIIGKVTDSLLKIAELDPAQLAAVSFSIGLIAGAITELGVALGAGGIMASIGEFFTWLSGAESPVDVLVKLASIAEPLGMAAESIMQIVNGLAAIKEVGDINVKKGVGRTIKDLQKAVAQIDEAVVTRKIVVLDDLADSMALDATAADEGESILGSIGGAITGLFDPTSAKKRMEEIQQEISNREANTRSVSWMIPRAQQEIARQDARGGPRGSMMQHRYDSAKADIEFIGGQIAENNAEVTKLTEELNALRALMAENGELIAEQQSAPPPTVVVNAPTTNVDQSSNQAFVAPQNSGNPRRGQGAESDEALM